ncbi:DUF177 domain-containing protein [bacterium]|nr:MAG: DUF177 domain-containing protein [bacterium]
MKLTVSRIPDSGIEEKLKLRISLSDDMPKQDVEVSFKAMKFGERVMIEGRAETTATLGCSRCLNNFSFPVNITFNTEYIPLRETGEESEHELTAEELDVGTYINDQIDLIEVVRGHILLSLPMKPLCNEQCKGICSHCGKNFNEGDCECRNDYIDPRLEPLKKLKIK